MCGAAHLQHANARARFLQLQHQQLVVLGEAISGGSGGREELDRSIAHSSHLLRWGSTKWATRAAGRRVEHMHLQLLLQREGCAIGGGSDACFGH